MGITINAAQIPVSSGMLAFHRKLISEGVKKGFLVSILPRHGLYVSVFEGDGQRFAALFQAAWRRIPLGERRLMLRHWRSGYGHGPEIFLSEDCFMPGRAMGMVNNYGHRIRFRAKLIARMPDDVVQDLIAHELAHVCQSARGIRCVRESRDGQADWVDRFGEPCGGNPEFEEDAAFQMSLWGFDPDSVHVWSRSVGLSKVISYDTNTEEGEKALGRHLARVLRHGR